MTTHRLWSAALLVWLALALVLADSWPASGDRLPAVRHVVVVTAPGLSLQDLRDGRLPRVAARRAAFGAMSVRAEHTRPDAAEGYLALGSGVRTRSVPAAGDEGRAATHASARSCERCGALRRRRVSSIDELRAANRGRHLGSAPGALGSALRAAGHDVVAVGDGPVALAAMDRSGTVTTARGALSALARRHSVVIAASRDRVAADRLFAAAPPDDTLVMLVSVSPAPDGWLTPIAIVGAGVPRGRVVSDSTRRDGIGTLTDVGPTILGVLGVPRPDGMVGRPLRVRAGAPQLERLIELDARSDRQARAYRPTMYLLGASLLALVALTLAGARRAAPAAAVVVAALPLATYLLALTPAASSTAVAVGLTAAIAVAAAAAVALVTRRARGALTAVLAVSAIVLATDAATSGWLHMTTMLGYSLPGGGRFYGVPNTTFALAGAAALLAGGLVVERRGRDVLPAVGAGFAVIALLISLPGLGSDVGGLLTLVPVFGLAWLGLAGRRLRPRDVAALIAAAIVLLVAFAGIDALRGDDERTHLGRLAADVADDGLAPLWDAIARKESANLRLLLSPWTPILAVVLLAMVLLRTRLGPAMRAAVHATLALAAVGFALNDSGAIVVALALFYLAPVLALHRPPESEPRAAAP